MLCSWFPFRQLCLSWLKYLNIIGGIEKNASLKLWEASRCFTFKNKFITISIKCFAIINIFFGNFFFNITTTRHHSCSQGSWPRYQTRHWLRWSSQPITHIGNFLFQKRLKCLLKVHFKLWNNSFFMIFFLIYIIVVRINCFFVRGGSLSSILTTWRQIRNTDSLQPQFFLFVFCKSTRGSWKKRNFDGFSSLLPWNIHFYPRCAPWGSAG